MRKKQSFLFLVLVGTILTVAGCMTLYQDPASNADYMAGVRQGSEAAREHAIDVGCSDRFPGSTRYSGSAPYIEKHRQAGRSDAFVRGFKDGFARDYPDYHLDYCNHWWDEE